MEESTFLLRCQQCSTPFFSIEEKKFYEAHNFCEPKLCQRCRKKRNIHRRQQKKQQRLEENHETTQNYLKIYTEILECWSVEARNEKKEYFYNLEEVDALIKGKKSFVIGRKGSGKTAIAQYLCEIKAPNVFSEKLSFKNFPFNNLYALENTKSYTRPNQYISLWKYLIYTYICKKMIKNESIDRKLRTQLEKLYIDDADSIENLSKLINQWTSKSFGLKFMGSGIDYSREKQACELTWIDSIDILEKIILNYCDSSNYFIIFDELDEDYKNFESEQELSQYTSMLTSLFKATQDIRTLFKKHEKNIFPIVFLRSDIYNRIMYSDKTKWRESIIDIEWTTNQIKNMLVHRLNVTMKTSFTDFNEIWLKLFSNKKVSMGNQQTNKMGIYEYIERSTEMRPRDYIQYIKECVDLAKQNNIYPISPTIVKNADDRFSEYLKGETIDEIFAIIPQAEEILGLFSTIRKQRFPFSLFEKEYNDLVKRKVVPAGDVKKILLTLFDAGVIGNQPKIKNQLIFKFSKKSPRFNFNETMIVHRGLYKSLQIY